LGHQQINFTVVKAALYWGGGFGYAELASDDTMDFIVSNKPLPTPTPTVPEFPTTIALTFLSLTALAVAVVSRRKHLTRS